MFRGDFRDQLRRQREQIERRIAEQNRLILEQAQNTPYNQLNRKLEAYRHDLAGQENDLRASVQGNLINAVNRLEAALLQVYKLGVYIRGDYDEREDDETLQKTIFSACEQAFNDCQTASDAGLQQLSDIHVKVKSFESPLVYGADHVR